MKMVTAIIKPFKLDDVRDALMKIGLKGITVSDVKGAGNQESHTELYRGAEYLVDFAPKIKLEIGIPAKMLAKVIEVIRESANTGKIGDGKIYVADIERAIRIRTEETGEDAL